MSGAVPPKRPRQPFGVGGWQQLAGCWIRLQSCLPHRRWGKIHKGHCRGKMLVRKTNGLFSFLLGFSETSTFTSHLSSTFFYPNSVFQSILGCWPAVWDRTQWNAHDSLGRVYPHLKVTGGCPQLSPTKLASVLSVQG